MSTDRWGLWLASLLGLVGFGGLVRLDVVHGTLRDGQVPHTISWYLVAFAGFGTIVWWTEHHHVSWRVLWLVPIAFRLMMLTTTPTLSDDVYRYLWDGHLVAEGVNPYSSVIDDPSLDRFDIEVRQQANNRDLSTPYLPAAQLVFGATAVALPSEPWALQVVMLAFDLSTAAMIVVLLGIAQLPRSRIVLYLWNPLVIVEIAHGAHVDALMIALTTASLVLTLDPSRRARPRAMFAAPVLLALATLTRPIPALLVPVLWWRWSWYQRGTYALTCVAAVVPLGIGAGFGLTGDSTGTGVFGAARVYAETFRFNSGIYHWFEQWVLGRGLDDRGWNEPVALTRLLVGAVLGAILIAVFWRAAGTRTEREALRLLVVPVAAYSLLTPVLHPWYLLILVVLVMFLSPSSNERSTRWLLLAPWAYLSATIGFSYLTYQDPAAFAELEWVRRLQWVPTLAMVAAVSLARVRQSEPVGT